MGFLNSILTNMALTPWRLFATRSQGQAFGICGGGETVEVLKKLKIMEEIDLVSTGGGAMLEFLSGKNCRG